MPINVSDRTRGREAWRWRLTDQVLERREPLAVGNVNDNGDSMY
jgi:hypothetical protein